jgi:hypothetical protein
MIKTKYPRHKLADDGIIYNPAQSVVTPKTMAGELISTIALFVATICGSVFSPTRTADVTFGSVETDEQWKVSEATASDPEPGIQAVSQIAISAMCSIKCNIPQESELLEGLFYYTCNLFQESLK